MSILDLLVTIAVVSEILNQKWESGPPLRVFFLMPFAGQVAMVFTAIFIALCIFADTMTMTAFFTFFVFIGMSKIFTIIINGMVKTAVALKKTAKKIGGYFRRLFLEVI